MSGLHAVELHKGSHRRAVDGSAIEQIGCWFQLEMILIFYRIFANLLIS